MQYSLHSEIFSLLIKSERLAEFRADPNTQDPTVKEGFNAFAILALKEPHKSEAGSVPEQARQKRRQISNTLNNTISNDTKLMDLFGTFQNYLTPACDLLATKELVEEHLDELWKRRMAALQEQFKIIKKHSAQGKWEADVRENAIALGFAEGDLELAATEILGTPPKSPKPRKTDAKPTAPTNVSASAVGRKINLGYRTLLLCLLPSIASFSFSLLLIAMQPGSFLDIQFIFQKEDDASVSPNIKPFGYGEKSDVVEVFIESDPQKLDRVDRKDSLNRDSQEEYNANAENLEPSEHEKSILRGLARHKQGDYLGAIEEYDEAIRIDSGVADVFNYRGIANHNLGIFGSAIRDYDEAIRLNSSHAAAFVNRAQSKHSIKNYQGAIEDHHLGAKKALDRFDSALRLSPEDANLFINRAWVKHNLRDYQGAINDYDTAHKLDPNAIQSLTNKAFLLSTAIDYRLKENAAEATTLAKSALAIDPTNPYAMNSMACALALADDFEAALSWRRKAMNNLKWMNDTSIAGGIHALDRIAKWESRKLWLQPRYTYYFRIYSPETDNRVVFEVSELQK